MPAATRLDAQHSAASDTLIRQRRVFARTSRELEELDLAPAKVLTCQDPTSNSGGTARGEEWLRSQRGSRPCSRRHGKQMADGERPG